MEKLTNIDINLIAKLPLKFASKFKAIPIREKDGEIYVAVADSGNLQVLDELRVAFGKEIKLVETPEDEINTAIKKYYGVGADTVARMVEESGSMNGGTDYSKEIENIDEDVLAQDASVIQFVNQLFLEALKERATDIHFEPQEKGLKIRLPR